MGTYIQEWGFLMSVVSYSKGCSIRRGLQGRPLNPKPLQSPTPYLPEAPKALKLVGSESWDLSGS